MSADAQVRVSRVIKFEELGPIPSTVVRKIEKQFFTIARNGEQIVMARAHGRAAGEIAVDLFRTHGRPRDSAVVSFRYEQLAWR